MFLFRGSAGSEAGSPKVSTGAHDDAEYAKLRDRFLAVYTVLKKLDAHMAHLTILFGRIGQETVSVNEELVGIVKEIDDVHSPLGTLVAQVAAKDAEIRGKFPVDRGLSGDLASRIGEHLPAQIKDQLVARLPASWTGFLPQSSTFSTRNTAAATAMELDSEYVTTWRVYYKSKKKMITDVEALEKSMAASVKRIEELEKSGKTHDQIFMEKGQLEISINDYKHKMDSLKRELSVLAIHDRDILTIAVAKLYAVRSDYHAYLSNITVGTLLDEMRTVKPYTLQDLAGELGLHASSIEQALTADMAALGFHAGTPTTPGTPSAPTAPAGLYPAH